MFCLSSVNKIEIVDKSNKILMPRSSGIMVQLLGGQSIPRTSGA